jgi:hypothetical protein
MEAILGTSLSQTSKTDMSLLSPILSLNKIREQEDGTGSSWKLWGWGGEVTQTVYTHKSKCKNDKIKEIKF